MRTMQSAVKLFGKLAVSTKQGQSLFVFVVVAMVVGLVWPATLTVMLLICSIPAGLLALRVYTELLMQDREDDLVVTPPHQVY